MTAEILIMNKSAIALAADSAVTVDTTAGPKIYNTADKLFRLSDSQPVGLMIYGNATFLRVPWEIVIKDYRKHLDVGSYPNLEDYSKDFIEFISKHISLFPTEEQEIYFSHTIFGYYNMIKQQIREIVEEDFLAKNEKLTDSKVSKTAGKVIRNYYDNLNKRDFLQNSSSSECKQILEKYSKIIDEAIENSFEKLPIYKKDIVKLAKIAGFLFCKDIFPKSLSGIVIAGFGVKDFFPKMRSYNLETIINGRLKYKDYIDGSIKHGQGAFMAPFAQGEMVHSFMKGIDPELYKFTEEYLFNIFKEYPKIIVSLLKNLSQSEKDKITEKFNEFSKEVYKDFFKALNDVVGRKFVDPIIDVVKILPKDELAAMAESLVNLTMFKQRVSPTAETVGGPIDVAIISKSDGFIWIKRKKYFDIELNPKYVIRRS